MKRRLLPLSLALIAPLFFMSACSEEDPLSKSAREIASAQAKAQNCSVSLMTGSCSADGSNIATIKCNGIELSINDSCPADTKCVEINEGIGIMPYCVPLDAAPECIISTCDPQESNKLKACVDGKYVSKSCGADEVCRVGGKSDAGKDLAAACEKKPTVNASEPKDAEDDMDPCKTAGHIKTIQDACSIEGEIAIYTCEDGYVMMENCYPFDCEAVNPRQVINAWIDESNDADMKLILKLVAASLPDKDMHGCNLSAMLEMMKDIFLMEDDDELPMIPGFPDIPGL